MITYFLCAVCLTYAWRISNESRRILTYPPYAQLITCFYSTASVCAVQVASIRRFGNLWGGGGLSIYMGPLSNSSSLLHGLSCWTHQPIINPSSPESMAEDTLRIRRTRQTYSTNTLSIRWSYARIRCDTLSSVCYKLVIRYQYVSHTLWIRPFQHRCRLFRCNSLGSWTFFDSDNFRAIFVYAIRHGVTGP